MFLNNKPKTIFYYLIVTLMFCFFTPAAKGKEFERLPYLRDLFQGITGLFENKEDRVKKAAEKFEPIIVFNDVTRVVENNFYDSKLKGLDWQGLKNRYATLAGKAKSRASLTEIINRMLAHLKVSHTRFLSKHETAYYQLLDIFVKWRQGKRIKKLFKEREVNYTGIGIFTCKIGGKVFIKGVLDGTPAAGADLKRGYQIISVDGKPFQQIDSFKGRAGEECSMLIQFSPEPADRKIVRVIPEKIKPNQAFLQSIKESMRIHKVGLKKIGYIHIWSYAGEQYQHELIRQLKHSELRDVDALVLDLRDGWGGAWPRYLNIFNNRIPDMQWIKRDGEKLDMDHQWRRPVVMLVNEGTRSGKEILAYGFKKFGYGKVIGTKTAGAVMAGRLYLLQDGSALYLAVYDLFVDGERLEEKGIIPDIEVLRPLEYSNGKDPQLEEAVKYLAAGLENR
ncbi:S41 family peptidase [Candidatus Riflebacteria bacterium]